MYTCKAQKCSTVCFVYSALWRTEHQCTEEQCKVLCTEHQCTEHQCTVEQSKVVCSSVQCTSTWLQRWKISKASLSPRSGRHNIEQTPQSVRSNKNKKAFQIWRHFEKSLLALQDFLHTGWFLNFSKICKIQIFHTKTPTRFV